MRKDGTSDWEEVEETYTQIINLINIPPTKQKKLKELLEDLFIDGLSLGESYGNWRYDA